MKRVYFLTIALLAATAGFSQTRISGKVTDTRGHILPGAGIAIKDSYDGGVADSTGRYSFRTSEKGAHTLEITILGYKTVTKDVVLGSEPVTLDFQLKEQLDELKAVTVTAGSFEAGDRKRAATVLSSLDILTTGGANADISAAVKTLPGAQQIGEQEGLAVRGGSVYETKQFIDGMLVNNPYYTGVPDIASRGRFSPTLFKGTVFSTGGYSALYGQALSSALILESIDLPEKSESTVSVSSVVLGAGFQELDKNKKYSYGASYNYVNVWPYFQIVKQTPDYFIVPQFHNGDANFRIKTKNGMIKYYTTFAYNTLGLRRPDIDSVFLKDAFSLTNHNWYNNLTWREYLSHGWKMNLGVSYSTNRDELGQQVQDQFNQPHKVASQLDTLNFNIKARQDLSQVRVVFEKRLSGISMLRVGAEYWYSYNENTYNNYHIVQPDHFQSVFAETDIYLTNDLAAKVGGRLEHSSIIDKINIAPRLSLAYKVGEGAQVSAAFGMFYQKPENTQLVYSTNLGYQEATHYILNYQKVANDRIFRVEAFYKTYKDLVKTFPVYNNSGSGYARGVELYIRDKRTIKNFDYWLSYSYLDTKRDYLNYPGQLQPNFAANHTASLVTKRYFPKLSFGVSATYTFATGRPYYDFLLNSSGTKYNIADQGKTIDYNSLGLSAYYLTHVGKAFAVLFASVTNALNQPQVYGYRYSYDGTNKIAVTPPANRFYFIGMFLSFGRDRSEDVINNNL